MVRMQLFKISSFEYLAQSCVRTEQAEEIVLLDSFLHRELNNLQRGDQLYASCPGHRDFNDLDYNALVTVYAVDINPGMTHVKGF